MTGARSGIHLKHSHELFTLNHSCGDKGLELSWLGGMKAKVEQADTVLTIIVHQGHLLFSDSQKK